MADYDQAGPMAYGRPPSEQYGPPSEQYGPPPPDGYGPVPGEPPYYGSPPSQAPYDYEAGGAQGTGGLGLGGDDQAYQQYTERKMSGNSIDRSNGIAPRRCTDCICMFVFLGYVVGMIILVMVCKTSTVQDRQWSDIQRLTHGHDFAGRLCGVDKEVIDKPYLYWCRDSPTENVPVPAALNLAFPSCVASCPKEVNATSDKTPTVTCLFEHTTNQMSLPKEQGPLTGPPMPFGTIDTYHIGFQQSEAETNVYATSPFYGRFCLPEDGNLRNEVIAGPMRGQRLLASVGSLKDPWGILFTVSVLAVVLSFTYLFFIFHCPRIFTVMMLYATWVGLSLAGLFFIYSVLPVIAERSNNQELLKVMKWKQYQEVNPFFEEHTELTAMWYSIISGAVLLFMSCGILGIITHIAGDNGFGYITDLLEAAQECLTAMPTMLIPPIIEALCKFLVMYLCGSNFMYLASVGTYDDERLVINGEHYKNRTAVYYFDWSVAPWMVLYLFGWVWLLEFVTSCGQFFISFATISYYFMRKQGHKKVGAPPQPPVYALYHLLHSHLGSVCLGAAIIPWIRIIRLINWVEDESVPDERAKCCPADSDSENSDELCITKCLNGICAGVGKICAQVTKCRKGCSPGCCLVPNSNKPIKDGYLAAGCAYRYTKNGYNDVIIRSQHYLQASNRALRLVVKNRCTRDFLLGKEGCQVLTAVGFVSIASLCALLTHIMIVSNSAYMDPSSDRHIPEPFLIDFLAFMLCGSIAYGFMALFEHTADTLLYCYAWNKKFASESGGVPVEEYIPECLRDILDVDDDDDDRQQLYGAAAATMYLRTYNTAGRQQVQQSKLQDRARQSALQMSAMGGSPAASGRSGSSRQFGFGTSQSVPYQALAQAGNP